MAAGNVALARLERIYLKNQSAFDVIPSFGNNDYVRHIKATLFTETATLIRQDKTGHRTTSVGARGRSYGKWTFNSSMVTSGTAGTAPPHDPIFQAAFCQAGTGAGGGWQYTHADISSAPPPELPTFAMASYRRPSTLDQIIMYGCTPNEITWKIGQDIAEFEASGEARFGLSSDYVASGHATSDELAGVSSFPAEPGSPVAVDGGIIAGFTGSISIGGSSVARLRTAEIKEVMNASVVRDTFNAYVPDDNQAGVRVCTISFNLYDDDEASEAALRVASTTKIPVDADITVGTVSGNMVNFKLKNIQLESPTREETELRFSQSWPASRAYGTDITTLDELIVTYL